MGFIVLLACFLMLPLTSLAQAICPDGFTEVSGFCYKYNISLALSWDEARLWCNQQTGNHLVVEVSAEEHAAFVSFRNSLPVQGDPQWTGLYVKQQGTWSFLADAGFLTATTLFFHWKGGKMPMANVGQCAATIQDGTGPDQVWDSFPCSLPLAFVCEANMYTPSGGGSETTTTTKSSKSTSSGPNPTTTPSISNPAAVIPVDSCRSWKKIFPGYKYTVATNVIPSTFDRAHAPSLNSCAILCTHEDGCVAFNHRPVDNSCEYILTTVNSATQLTSTAGWDVWVETW